MSKKILTIVFCFAILIGLFVRVSYANYLQQIAINDANEAMFFHCVDNFVKPKPFSNTGCGFEQKNLVAFPYVEFSSWEWSCFVRCYNNGGRGFCVNLVLVTLWVQLSDGSRQIMNQQCVDISQTCGQDWHIINGDIAPSFPVGYPTGTYYLNVGLWDGSCSAPGSNLIAAVNSPTYVVH